MSIEELYSIILLGIEGVGKKTIIEFYKKNFQKWPGREYYIDKLTRILFKLKKGKVGKLLLSNYTYSPLLPVLLIDNLNYYDYFIFVIDYTNKESFIKVKEWITELKKDEKRYENLGIVIFCNKSDLIEEKQIDPHEIEQFVKENKIEYFNTNAKDGYQLNEGLSFLVNLAHYKRHGDEKEIWWEDDNEEEIEKEETNEYKYTDSSSDSEQDGRDCCCL